jgi:hypothetical protein
MCLHFRTTISVKLFLSACIFFLLAPLCTYQWVLFSRKADDACRWSHKLSGVPLRGQLDAGEYKLIRSVPHECTMAVKMYATFDPDTTVVSTYWKDTNDALINDPRCWSTGFADGTGIIDAFGVCWNALSVQPGDSYVMSVDRPCVIHDAEFRTNCQPDLKTQRCMIAAAVLACLLWPTGIVLFVAWFVLRRKNQAAMRKTET